jgi:endogenous inhibitor of DNA gyrase (YacG/DUF329 family)
MAMPERCPICRKPSLAAVRPFCSQRCADIDLGRWLTAQYVVPGADGEAEPAGPGEADGDA